MKRLILLVFVFLTTSLFAQQLPNNDARNSAFGKHIAKIVADNNIPDPTRMPIGTEYKLPDGTKDSLLIGDENGIWGREFAKWYGIPYSNFLAGQKPVDTTIALPNKVVIEDGVEKAQGFSLGWLWGVLALAVLSIAYFWVKRFRATLALEREMSQNPVTSGTPYVPGGIPSTEPERLQQFFEQQAINNFAQRNPNIDRNTIRVEQVGPIEEGSISGEGEVGYLGQGFRPRRIDPAVDAYQGRYRYQDGTEEILQSLVRCMNPVRFGGEMMRGFTFTRRQTVVPVPPPPTPAPQPAPHPAMAVRRIREEAGMEGNSTLAIGDRVITIERGVHITVDEATGVVTVIGNSFEMAVKPKRQKVSNGRQRQQLTGQ